MGATLHAFGHNRKRIMEPGQTRIRDLTLNKHKEIPDALRNGKTEGQDVECSSA